MSSVLFHSMLNFSSALSFEHLRTKSGQCPFSPEELEQGALDICKALQGMYTTPTGRRMPVAGDLSKILHIKTLSAAGRALLTGARALSAKIPGTDEVRVQMRYETNAMRVRYGLPIFVTVSPDAKHNVLLMRMSRTRRNDPIRLAKEAVNDVIGIAQPPMGPDLALFAVEPSKLEGVMPSYDERRALAARDATASVDSFRTALLLILKHIFGIRCCPDCPRCNSSPSLGEPCQDVFGSNAEPEGGVFGRVDGVFVSIEAQKSAGDLHGHMQLFVQCLHQHTPLFEIALLPSEMLKELMDKYLHYKAMVCSEMYHDIDKWTAEQAEIECEWPEYKTVPI